MAELIFAAISLIALFGLAMNRASLRAWALAAAIFTLSAQMGLVHGHLHWPAFPLWSLLGWLVAGLLFVASLPEIKRKYIVLPAYRALKGAMPTISETEREALEAGTVGWDAELFSGTPNWAKLRRVAPITLTPEERAFLDGPTVELCKQAQRLAHPPRAARHSRRHLALRLRPRLSRHAHLQEAWRLGLLRPGAVAHSRQDLLAQPRRRHHRHGAEFARSRRADREIRHRRPEGALLAASGAEGRRSPALR